MQPGPGGGGVPGPAFFPPTLVAHPDEQDVALADTDALVALGGGDVAGRDVVARFQPRHPTQAGDIKDHAAAGDAVGGDGDGELDGAGGGDGAGGHAAVEGAEASMAQGVDVAVGAPDVHGIRSAANSRPSSSAPGAWTIRCWAGSGLSALT